MSKKTWFIAGASRGLGRVWAEAALKRGDKVAATVRTPDAIGDLVTAYGEDLLPLVLDVTDRAGVFSAIAETVRRFGRIDVVVSNAGYGLFGTIEESNEVQARAQFETNFFGTLWVVQAALPQLRMQRSGHILVTSSLAGIITFPTAGIYNSTKWAVEGLTDTLAQEVADFGIRVTLLEPGGYDTDWRGASSTHTTEMPEYDSLRTRLKAAYGARVLGDPRTTAAAILKVVDSAEPPLRIFLGNAGLPVAQRIYADRLSTWTAWSEISANAQGRAAT
jgi:NAD(P)-dependent dehydrogenase (short-subunit alcohol dehydrogenase family)